MAITPTEVAQMITKSRLRKATKFVETLQARGFTIEQVRALDSHGWHIVAAAAGRKPAREKEALSEQTKELVIAILKSRARDAAKHPWERS